MTDTADTEPEGDLFAIEIANTRRYADQLADLLATSIAAVASGARDIADMVGVLDDRQTQLNEIAVEAGMGRLPDFLAEALPADDTDRVRVLQAARTGPAATAAALGLAARDPAAQDVTDTEAEQQAAQDTLAAARTAVSLLTLTHHDITSIDARTILEDTDPALVCTLLAQTLLATVAQHGGDVSAWIASVGATWAVTS